jgi:hypothetical protein
MWDWSGRQEIDERWQNVEAHGTYYWIKLLIWQTSINSRITISGSGNGIPQHHTQIVMNHFFLSREHKDLSSHAES